MWPVRGREIAQEDPRHAKEQDEIRNAVQDDEERLQAEVEAFEKRRRRPAPPPARRRRLSYSSITEAEAVRVLSENADAARVSFVEEQLRADATQEAEVLMASFHAHEEEEQQLQDEAAVLQILDENADAARISFVEEQLDEQREQALETEKAEAILLALEEEEQLLQEEAEAAWRRKPYLAEVDNFLRQNEEAWLEGSRAADKENYYFRLNSCGFTASWVDRWRVDGCAYWCSRRDFGCETY